VIRKSRRTRIVVETERLQIVRARPRRMEQWCEGCGAVVSMVPLDEAAVVAATSQRDMVHRIDAGSVHLVAVLHGVLFICLPSLLPEKPNA
jgi:hypothetical protein